MVRVSTTDIGICHQLRLLFWKTALPAHHWLCHLKILWDPQWFLRVWRLPRLPQWFCRKESTCNAGDTGDTVSVPGSGRSPGGGKGNPLQYSRLENSMDRGSWRTTVCGVAESDTTDWLSTHAHRVPKARMLGASAPQYSTVLTATSLKFFSCPISLFTPDTTYKTLCSSHPYSSLLLLPLKPFRAPASLLI